MLTQSTSISTMTFGLESTNAETSAVRVRGIENVKPFLDTLKAYGYDEVDTARAYGNGDTELTLGQLLLESFKISTKIWPGTVNAFGPENIRTKVKESLAALKATKVDILYLHAVDETTPIEVTIKVMDELYREGVFNRLVEAKELINLCDNAIELLVWAFELSCMAGRHNLSPMQTEWLRLADSLPRSVQRNHKEYSDRGLALS
ncbi:hypothetical protein BGZ46_001503 [Entomortierella lignicola]|nr:hypothetical protein BGZ46_001503 [Entomortierella lignicola]